MLIIHYTDMESGEAALQRLSDPAAEVSAHYLIERDGRLFQLVDDARRAWHAGRGGWLGARDINSISIGIELVNAGHTSWDWARGEPQAYPPQQIDKLIDLAHYLCAVHGIASRFVLGHSDVAPDRKQDPGSWFPWEKLAVTGLGLWPQIDEILSLPTLNYGDESPAVRQFQASLVRFGYPLSITGVYDQATKLVVTAFQRHFRQHAVTGEADAETQSRLLALLAMLPEQEPL